MFLKQTIRFVIFALVVFIISPPNIHAQKKRIVGKKVVKTVKKTKKPTTKKIISGGVLNTKAVNLVKPEFSEAARKVGVRGVVVVEVLIDELGNVIKAKALRGNPFLIPNSVKAARMSKFAPFVLESGEALRVSGVIHYNYLGDQLNWLEIGYGFEDSTYLYSNKLENYLPPGFEEERLLFIQLKTLNFDEQNETRQAIISSIENKLSSDNKNFWLFSVGKEIGSLSKSFKNDKNEILDRIQNLLYSAPDGISPILKTKLKNLLSVSKAESNEFNDSLVNLVERLNLIGN